MTDVIPGAVAGFRLLADNTVRVTVDISPQYAAEAKALCGSIGQSLAIAALKDGYASVPAAPAPKDKIGPLCREAIELCANPKFHEFITVEHWNPTPDAAKGFILSCCGIESRKELDTNAEAATIFRRRVRSLFQQWLRGEVK